MKMKRTCENPWCGKAFEADHWDVARKWGRFCRKKCLHEWMSIRMSGNKKKTKEV